MNHNISFKCLAKQDNACSTDPALDKALFKNFV